MTTVSIVTTKDEEHLEASSSLAAHAHYENEDEVFDFMEQLQLEAVICNVRCIGWAFQERWPR